MTNDKAPREFERFNVDMDGVEYCSTDGNYVKAEEAIAVVAALKAENESLRATKRIQTSGMETEIECLKAEVARQRTAIKNELKANDCCNCGGEEPDGSSPICYLHEALNHKPSEGV